MEVVAPYPDAANLADAVRAALEPFDVRVTTERPPEYMPYFLLMPGLEPFGADMSFSCTSGGHTCAGRRRNSIASTNDGTVNCVNPDITQQALYAIGRMIGLEGSENEADPMHFPPNYAVVAPAAVFQDVCTAISPQFEVSEPFNLLPLECTNVDHEAGNCEVGS